MVICFVLVSTGVVIEAIMKCASFTDFLQMSTLSTGFHNTVLLSVKYCQTLGIYKFQK